MKFFSYHYPRPSGVKSYHVVLKFHDFGTTFNNILLNVEKNPSHESQKTPQGNAGIVMRWFRAGPLSIFDFQKFAGLWLARLINNHVRIYGSNVAEGSSVGLFCFCFVLFVFSIWRHSCYIVMCNMELHQRGGGVVKQIITAIWPVKYVFLQIYYLV